MVILFVAMEMWFKISRFLREQHRFDPRDIDQWHICGNGLVKIITLQLLSLVVRRKAALKWIYSENSTTLCDTSVMLHFVE